MKLDIKYTTYITHSNEGPWVVYLFYVDGRWDGWKRTEEEALAKYPEDVYNWVKFNSDED